MASQLQTINNSKIVANVPRILENILQELRLLRNEIKFLLPQEDLEGYANPERLKQSYDRAAEQYPPASL